LNGTSERTKKHAQHMTRHFIVYALGTSGDIDPMVALATELVQRGYKVSFLSNDYFAPIISAAGCDFVSVGSVEQYHQGNSASAWERDNRTDNFEYYHAPAFEPAFRFIQQCAEEKQVVLLVLGGENGAAVAAEKFNLPFIGFILSPNLIFSAHKPPAPMRWVMPKFLPAFVVRFLLRRYQKIKLKQFFKEPHLADYLAVRKQLDCWPQFQIKSKAILQIGFFPQWYGMPAKDWPRNIHLVGFPLQNRPGIQSRYEFDRLVEKMGAPVIFTTGTGVKDVQALFSEGRKMCEALQLPGVFVGGSDGASFLQGSSWCMHFDYLDFEYAFAKAQAVIHHGGIGTTAQAIKAGIPQLIRPLKYDQPDNADRIYRLGLGTYVMPEKFTAESVMPILRNMLQKSKQSKALRKFSVDVQNSSAIVDACDLIEEALPN
jgi:rhamnosyltransferase subunit B